MTCLQSAFIYSLLLILPLACHSQKPVPNGDIDQNIEVELGDSFEISLPTHPGTGFTWEIKTPPDSTIVRFLEKTYLELGDETLDFPGEDVFEYMAVARGSTTVTFWYIRPWKKEHDYPGIKTERFTIKVE